jgi:acyl-CoA synthetase (NDP forming)
MDFFFNPKGIAVIGATTNPHKGGNSILKNIVTGFKGGIYPVNPRYSEIESLTCYDSVLNVPDPVDLAIVFVPAQIAVQAVKECARRGIKGVIIQSAGFAETGTKGQLLQDELLRIREETGIRLWGPNCMGLVDAVNGHVFSFVIPLIWDYGLEPGNVSLIVQSGMLSAGFLIDTVSHGTMGISKACSIGNKVDVNECDVLEYLIQDPDTTAIGAYLESITDGKRFLTACRNTTKPIVILKGGKSEKGARAAMSHTSSLAGDSAVISGALAQVQVTEANDFKQMLDHCRTQAAYAHLRHKSKGRTAILTFSGGAGIVSADFVEQMGLEVADLSPQALQQLAEVFPEWMPPSNPIDMWPAVEKNGPKKVFHTAFKAVCSDPGVDAILFHIFIHGAGVIPDISPLISMAREHEKPLFVWLLGKREEAFEFQKSTQNQGVPVYRELHRAVECMAAFFK